MIENVYNYFIEFFRKDYYIIEINDFDELMVILCSY